MQKPEPEVRTFIKLELLAILPNDEFMGSVEQSGDYTKLAQLLEWGMHRNQELATIVIGAALFYLDETGQDISALVKTYREEYKERK